MTVLTSNTEVPAAQRVQRGWPTRSRATALWLFAVAVVVIGMVIVGGATRLTGSGLSITEWKPLSGALPPLSERTWTDLFAKYRAIPQYRVVNPDMTLAGFKSIFWWEWAHRLLGRTVGVVFAVPLVVLLATRRLPRRLLWPCVGLFFLGGLQGAVGWWMVSSGLETRLYVAPERLATHLGLALILFAALIWTGLEAWAGPATRQRSWGRTWPRALGLFAGGVFVQCLLGALVAGNHAGLANADWPMMGGRIFPADYVQGGVWTTLVHGLAAVQFNHRIIAYTLAVAAFGLAGAALRSRGLDHRVRALVLTILAVVIVQIALGIGLLLWTVPLPAALLHQLTASLLLALSVAAFWTARRVR